jgi:hypothetical protein
LLVDSVERFHNVYRHGEGEIWFPFNSLLILLSRVGTAYYLDIINPNDFSGVVSTSIFSSCLVLITGVPILHGTVK